MPLRTSDFDYDLPQKLIAQTPVERRDQSRLMVLDRAANTIEHRRFDDLPIYLRAGDALVLNETRVIPARLLGKKEPGGARVEILLIREIDHAGGLWDAMVRPSRRLSPGSTVTLDGRGDRVVIDAATSGGLRRVVLPTGPSPAELGGELPLPPYIHEASGEPERYQTVYGRLEGSVAAPTAGLHFTSDLLGKIETDGVSIVRVVLHVGPGTFRPVKNEDPLAHEMGTEAYDFPPDAARAIQQTRSSGGRVVCVGTTSVRVVETVSQGGHQGHGEAESGSGETGLFIMPGYQFKSTDAMVTNFHLPRSTLLMLVAAFAGKEFVDRAYRSAIAEKYRFYSFGDAMLIL